MNLQLVELYEQVLGGENQLSSYLVELLANALGYDINTFTEHYLEQNENSSTYRLNPMGHQITLEAYKEEAKTLRNIGVIKRNNGTLITERAEINFSPMSQVYQATHDGQDYKPYLYRSFISFSYGGRNIEDFNLLCITENNAIQRSMYAPFKDNVTESDIIDGRKYWSTHFEGNELSLILFTDGVTEKQLNDFKKWFSPGKYQELVLAEAPNRAILARVSESPKYSIIPFEGKENVKVAGQEYSIFTTMYKGRIDITFTMDEPFWYARTNILQKGTYTSGRVTYQDAWMDANQKLVSPFDSIDALKIIREDGIPVGVMLSNVNNLNSSTVINGESVQFKDTDSFLMLGTKELIGVLHNSDEYGSLIGSSQIDLGHVAYYIAANTNREGVSLPQANLDNPASCQYFYYAGTAPTYPIINFTLTPKVDTNTSSLTYGYILSPFNSFSNYNNLKYNSIVLEGKKKKVFKFTTPNFLTSYNQAIKIFKEKGDLTQTSLVDLRALLRDGINHYLVRAYAISITNQNSYSQNMAIQTMIRMIKDVSNDTFKPITFQIDCKNGQVIATIQYHSAINSSSFSTVVENAGDMVRSSYLIIDEQNYFNSDGYIAKWEDSNDITKSYSHRVYTDVIDGLSNFSMEYKYMYL